MRALAPTARPHGRSALMCDAAKHCAVQGERLFAFERYMVFRKSGGNHCQVNALAVPAAAAEGAADVLTRAAEAAGFALMPLKGPHEVCLSKL